MKRILLPTFAILIATLFIALLPTEAEAGIYEDTIRIHILANSDSEHDQKIKLEVRDKLLVKYSEILGVAENIEAAESRLRDMLGEIEESVDGWVAEYGYDSTVSLGVEWFETRNYDGFSLPAGYYTSLIVKIGEAEGKNWWCVMYPPMCLDVATSQKTGYSDAEENLIAGKYRVKFKILELVSKSLRKN